MAARREGPLKIHLVHGAKNHTVTLSPDDCNEVVGVGHLAAAAYDISGIPPDKQKLIFKGKTLQCGDTSKSLRSLGLKDGSKVMLLGSKPSASGSASDTATVSQHVCEGAGDLQPSSPFREDLNKLQSFECSLDKETKDLHAILEQLDKINSGGKSGSGDRKELEQLKKKLMEVTERFMRLLESLDSLRFDSSDPTSRGRRKAMVDKIQRLMDQCEELSSSVKQKMLEDKQ